MSNLKKVKIKAYQAQYRFEHKEKNKAYQKQYYQETKELQKAYRKAYRASHNKEFNEYNKLYRQRHKGKVNATARKRQAAKQQRTPKWLTLQDFEIIKLFYEAAVALTQELGVKFVVDHIIPLRGKTISGLHVPSNLQVITKYENDKKGNRWPY